MSLAGGDAKLMHLVRKVVSSCYSNDEAPINVDKVVHCLRTHHREYQRKDIGKLKRQVQKIISKELDSTTLGGSDASPKKRSLEEMLEDRYEKQARQHDAQRSSLLNEGNLLNSGLRERYQKQQQQRDTEARAEAAAMVAAETQLTGEKKGALVSDDNKMNHVDNPRDRASKDDTVESSKSPKALKRKKSTAKRGSRVNGIARRGVEGSENDFGSGLTSIAVTRPKERYCDLGGMGDILIQIRQLVEYPLVRPELYRHLGIDPPRGVLLRGPPGCGKTLLANAIAGQLGVPYFRVSAPELVSGMSGESESRIRDLFQAASDAAPSIIFLDELDAIAPKRSEGGSSRGMEKRMVAQLLTCLDQLDPQYTRQNAPVMVLGATNRSDSIDPALRRAGRFDKEILLGVPDEEARIGILKTMTQGMKLSGNFDYKVLARKTPGFVGADIRSLTKEAAVIAINRIFSDVLKDQIPASVNEQDISMSSMTETIGSQSGNNHSKTSIDVNISKLSPLTEEQMEPLHVTMEDFVIAVPMVQPSSKREGFATVPDVTWADIGALGTIREELTLSVLEPIRNPEKFQALGIPLPAGVMLYGPPGCGKTLLAKAIANESGANFISVKGPELLDKYVGESERAVRQVFERARSSSPCIVFFDELDSLCPKRGSDGGGGGGVSERVVNQLLTEMDGLESRRSVFVIAATNRPELIDPAMMRPGRLDKLLYVPLPTSADRVSVLQALSKNIKLGSDVDLQVIGNSPRAEGYSGADCAALLREAGLAVLKASVLDAKEDVEDGDNLELLSLCITASHFDYAFKHVMPSVSKKDQARYDRIRDRMARARSRGGVTGGEDAADSLTPADDASHVGKSAATNS